MNDIINYDYLNNISDIICYKKDNKFNNLLDKVDDSTIIINNRLLHKNNITHKELFYFNLDNYISFIKDKLKINQLEIRYLISLTLYNMNNKILLSKNYYYDNVEYYNKGFIDLFMYNYYKNYDYLIKFIKIKKYDFNNLIELINKNKKSIIFLESINSKNIDFYLPIIQSII